MQNHTSESEKQAFERVKGLLFLRLAAVLVSLVVILVSQVGKGAFHPSLYPTYTVLVLISLVNLAYLLVARRIRRVRRFLAFQIYVDVLAASCLIYLSGAGGSNITFLYFACILAASILLNQHSGVMVASIASATLCAMTTLTFLSGHYGWQLPLVGEVSSDVSVPLIRSGVAFLIARAAAYYLVAILAGRLAHGLRREKILNDKILETMNDGVLVIDTNRRVRMINHQAIDLMGLTPGGKRIGKKLDALLASSENSEILRDIFTGEGPGVAQVSLKTANGRLAPVGVTSSSLLLEDGRKVGVVVMFIDLTERKRLDEALARAEMMEMVGQLAASIAHEIRNPLACIRGSAQEIRRDSIDDEQSRRLLDLVVRESDRINTIITDFLHFSKMRQAVLTKCNLTEVLLDAVTMLESRETQQPVSIDYHYDEPVYCLGDVEQLRQVFLNLGFNALDAMPDGGCLTVRVRSERSDDMWYGRPVGAPKATVEFTDSGSGVPEDMKDQLFVPFFTTKQRGTGLGLSIVRRIVEAHKGTIEVESIAGEGSTFRVVLEGYSVPELQVSHV